MNLDEHTPEPSILTMPLHVHYVTITMSINPIQPASHNATQIPPSLNSIHPNVITIIFSPIATNPTKIIHSPDEAHHTSTPIWHELFLSYLRHYSKQTNLSANAPSDPPNYT